MRSTKYLYGDIPEELVFRRKMLAKQFIEYAEKAYNEIAQKRVKHNDDIVRALDIQEAIKFNKFIIKETD